MRLLVLSETFPPPVEGGSEIYISQLAARVAPHATRVIAPVNPRAAEYDPHAPFEIVRPSWYLPTWFFPFPKFALHLMRLTAEVTRQARDFGATAILASPSFPNAVVGWQAATRLGLPWATIVYGEEAFQVHRGKGLFSPARRVLLREPLKHAPHVFTISAFSRAEAIQCGARPEAIEMVYPGVDPTEFHPGLDGRAIREKHGLGTRPMLLSCGRLYHRKGQDALLRAVPALMREVPDVCVVLVGEGMNRQVLGDLARELGIADRVVFAGSVPRAELPLYYAACDVFVMTYRQKTLGETLDSEGFGMVLVEANACGKPSVAHHVGGVSDAIVDGVTGFLIEEGDEPSLVQTLSRLLRDPALRATIGAAGRARVERELTWEAAAAHVHRVLEEAHR